MKSFAVYVKSPKLILQGLVGKVTRKCSKIIKNDEFYIRLMYWAAFGKSLNLKTPQTFSEKLQWLKLHDHKPEYSMMVDKYAVKEYVAKKIGEEFVIPTYGVWDGVEDIEWDKLPNQFVIKSTHDSGSVVICKDKSNFNKQAAIIKLKASLKHDFYKQSREWPYKDVRRRIIAEQYISPAPNANDLPDYKFFCFNGKPQYCQVITGRGTGKMYFDFFDKDWNHQPFHEPQKYGFATPEPQRPQRLNEMWTMAEKLAEGKPFSRIDFYQIGDKIYFGEITFYPTGGMGGFDPEEYDRIFGDMISIYDN